jgi:hypothetical protein
MSVHETYREMADEVAFSLEVLAAQLREDGPNRVASGLASTWMGPLVTDLARLAQLAELCRVWDSRSEPISQPRADLGS